MDAGELAIHGLWNDIREGNVEFFDSQKNKFLPMSED